MPADNTVLNLNLSMYFQTIFSAGRSRFPVNYSKRKLLQNIYVLQQSGAVYIFILRKL